MEIQIPYVIPLSTQKPKNFTLVPSDPGSRYKTRQLQVQVVGKSKMIKTVLLNILDVAKDMQVPPSYIGTFMGYVIGAQAKFDPKKPERQQSFLSGEHDPKDLSKILQSFIMEVLLCPVCGLPEILIKPEGKNVMGTCRACGSHSPLKINDEKFKKYVFNHPPTQGAKGAFGGNKTGAKKDTSKSESKDKDKDKEKEEEKEVEEPKKEKKEKREKREEEIVWLSDTSEEAVRKRREGMLSDTKEELSRKSVEELTNALKESLSIKDAVQADAIAKVKSEKKADDTPFITALFGILFASDCDLLTETRAKSAILSQFVKSNDAQISLLFAIERFCGKINPSQVTKIPVILKELYDKDILDEESVLEWSDRSKDSDAIAEVRTQAAPMIKWLKEAEEESDEDDEEEDDEEDDA